MFEFICPQRYVDTVFLHCSASDHDHHDDWSVIDKWHRDNGWDGIGYHFFVTSGGTIQEGRDLEKTPAAQYPHNRNTIAICNHGLKTFRPQSLDATYELCVAIKRGYWDKFQRRIRFRGHCEVERSKTCPVYDYKRLLNLDIGGYMPD